MTNFLLLVSLILNIIALFAIIILYLRQNRFANMETKQEKMLHEMEETISTYLMQMQEENEQFINKIIEVNRRSPKIGAEVKNNQLEETVELPPLKKNSAGQKRFASATVYQATKAYKQPITGTQPINFDEDEVALPPIDKEKRDEEIIPQVSQSDSLIEQAILLSEQGLSYEEIAKKLNKGKTEIELLLKFNRKMQE
ncbi:hypothetical protein SM124_17200 [Bacillus sp. 31A1R]|uniref:Coupling factor for flagellin transcription and translation n=1 Tax=Robertmurraya mangrovi TaxID=3098077 RepID=A0ABU5J223_9BACI|nr:hypothetical protein [Bacillus sp. 31A1R]MDZ5473453.1 hypothetical protein [Bacillus sp. 31A1R]